MLRFVLALPAAGLLAACTTLGPDYVAPKVETPPTFVGASPAPLVEAASAPWWRAMRDPVLNGFVDAGLAANLDVRTAIERIVEAEENARRFGLVQQVEGGVRLDGRRQKPAGGSPETVGNATADAFFVFDLFGEFRRSREQSLAQLEAARFDAATVKLAFLADIVAAYVRHRQYRAAAAITARSIRSRRETLRLVTERVRAEEGTSLEIAQARALLRSAEAQLPLLKAQAQVEAFRIATLLDMPAQEVLARLARPRSQPWPTGRVTTGVPADLLRNRPDIRAAERRLAAATAAIGVREAQLYPALRLGGTITLGDPRSWWFGPSLVQPLLDRPRRVALRNIARSRARQAELAYRSEVNRAVEEVQAALMLMRARNAQAAALGEAVRASREAQELARRSFEEGLVTFDEVLDAERTVLANERDLTVAVAELAQAWVRLQVALGKGTAAGPSPAQVAAAAGKRAEAAASAMKVAGGADR